MTNEINFFGISVFFWKIVTCISVIYKTYLSPSVTYIMKFGQITIFSSFTTEGKSHLADSIEMPKRKL